MVERSKISPANKSTSLLRSAEIRQTDSEQEQVKSSIMRCGKSLAILQTGRVIPYDPCRKQIILYLCEAQTPSEGQKFDPSCQHMEAYLTARLSHPANGIGGGGLGNDPNQCFHERTASAYCARCFCSPCASLRLASCTTDESCLFFYNS